MAVKKNPLKPQDNPIDPALQAHMSEDPLYGEMERKRRAQLSRTPAQRRQAERDAKRNKVTYDLPSEMTVRVAGLAEEIGCPPSHVAAVLLGVALEMERAGGIDFDQFKVPSSVPRYEWFLRFSEGGPE